jgi:hypothetical protein
LTWRPFFKISVSGNIVFPVNGDIIVMVPRLSNIYSCRKRRVDPAIDRDHYYRNSRASATAEKARAVMVRSVSMIGTYRLDGNTLHLVTSASSFLNWSGTDQIRIIQTLDADALAYGKTAASSGGQAIVTWKRVHRHAATLSLLGHYYLGIT